MSLVDRLTKEEKTGLYIGGEWRPASDGRTIAVVDPATELRGFLRLPHKAFVPQPAPQASLRSTRRERPPLDAIDAACPENADIDLDRLVQPTGGRSVTRGGSTRTLRVP